jgi:hypothetical protein
VKDTQAKAIPQHKTIFSFNLFFVFHHHYLLMVHTIFILFDNNDSDKIENEWGHPFIILKGSFLFSERIKWLSDANLTWILSQKKNHFLEIKNSHTHYKVGFEMLNNGFYVSSFFIFFRWSWKLQLFFSWCNFRVQVSCQIGRNFFISFHLRTQKQLMHERATLMI